MIMHNKFFNFRQQFTINSDEYTLTKTEISFGKVGKAASHQTIKLNELDPYYECVSYLPLSSLLLLGVYMTGFLVALGFIFFGHAEVHAYQGIRMVWGILLILFLAYTFKKNYVQEWRFCYFTNAETALTIRFSKKTKLIAQQLAELVSQGIKKSEKSNEHVVRLLSRYGLLTEREYHLLTAKLFEVTVPQANSNVISLWGEK
jgi:hypothetical protein